MAERDCSDFATLCFASFVVLLGACMPDKFDPPAPPMESPQPAFDPFETMIEPTESAFDSTGTNTVRSTFRSTMDGDDLGGVSYVSRTTSIEWAAAAPGRSDGSGATPEAVLAALVSRLEHLQKSPQASDRNARALWELNKALQIYRGELP